MKTLYMVFALLAGPFLTGMTQVLSDFESGNTDGWVSEGDGDYYWESGMGNPGACFRVDDDATGDYNRAYSPLKFLGDWSSATISDTLKADIFCHRINGSYTTAPNFLFRIAGPGGQATGILDPTPPYDTWTTYKISLSSTDWQLNSGTWSGLLQNVTTLIISVEFVNGDEYNRLDNVRLSLTPVQRPVVPVVCSGFEDGGYEGWTFQGTGGVSNQASGGSPGRYIQLANATSTAYALAPTKFLGNWNMLDNHAADIYFDMRVTATTGTIVLNDAFMRITGPGGTAKFPMTSNIQEAFGQWHTFAFPVMSSAWIIESGTWNQIISQVTELRVCLEITSGNETVSFDDFCISNLPPVADFTADYTYTFVGNPVSFTDLSDHVPDSWVWNFGDAVLSTVQNPVHTYSQPGLYTVTLTASNHYGNDTKQVVNYIEVAAIGECLKYADNFNVPAINQAWTINNGTWAVNTAAMRQSSNYFGATAIDACYAVTGSLLWQDYFISADMQSTDNDQLGLVFNFQDFQNMYMFAWNLQTPGRYLYKWVNGVSTVLASDNTGYAINTWYNVKVGGYNGYYTLTIDGQEIFGVQDNAFATGKAGLYCWGNQNSIWDNVLIECAVNDSVVPGNTTLSSGQNECYEATQVITVGGNGTTFTVQNGAEAALVAGLKVRMLPSTTVFPGGKLHAWISPNGFYCNGPAGMKAITAWEQVPGTPVPAFTEDKPVIRCYPNPTTGRFTVDPGETGKQERISVEIYNLLGEMVVKSGFSSENPQVQDLSNHPEGIYLVKILHDNKVRTGKVVLTR